MNTDEFYVVSARQGKSPYESAILFRGENAEADANEYADTLTDARPNSKHHVTTGKDFASNYGKGK